MFRSIKEDKNKDCYSRVFGNQNDNNEKHDFNFKDDLIQYWVKKSYPLDGNPNDLNNDNNNSKIRIKYDYNTWNAIENYFNINLRDIFSTKNPNYIMDNHLKLTPTDLNNNARMFITYNDVPLYEVNMEPLTKLWNYESYENLFNLIFYKGSVEIDPKLYEELSKENYRLLDQILVNVSNKIDLNHSNVAKDYVNRNTYVYKPENSYLETKPGVYDKDAVEFNIKKNNQYLAADKYIPHLSNKENEPYVMTGGIISAIDLYNQNLESLGKLDPITKRFVDINGIKANEIDETVALFNQELGVLKNENLYYSEVPYGAKNFNLSLSDATAGYSFATTQAQLDTIKNNLSAFTKPRPIWILDCDILDDDYFLNAASPQYDDSPELILENALRTTRLSHDTNYVMYHDPYDGSWTPILRNRFMLYVVEIENKEYYYLTLDLARKAVEQYIKLHSYVPDIKG